MFSHCRNNYVRLNSSFLLNRFISVLVWCGVCLWCSVWVICVRVMFMHVHSWPCYYIFVQYNHKTSPLTLLISQELKLFQEGDKNNVFLPDRCSLLFEWCKTNTLTGQCFVADQVLLEMLGFLLFVFLWKATIIYLNAAVTNLKARDLVEDNKAYR